MHTASLDVTAVHAPNESRLVLRGEFDVTSAYLVDAEVRRALEHGARRVVLDMSAMRVLDMCGVRTLIEGARAARTTGASMRLAGVGGAARALVDALSAQQLLGMDQSPECG